MLRTDKENFKFNNNKKNIFIGRTHILAIYYVTRDFLFHGD